MKTSNFLSLDWHDLGKGFVVAFIAFGLNWLQTAFVPSLDISPEIKILIISGIAYLAKNFFTDAKEVKSISNIGLPKPRDPKA
jgi:hypothetical protein